MDVRISLAVDLVERLLEDCKGIRDPVGEPEGAAELDGDVAASRRDEQDLESGRRWSTAAGPFVSLSARRARRGTSARPTRSVSSSSARVRYSTAVSAAP